MGGTGKDRTFSHARARVDVREPADPNQRSRFWVRRANGTTPTATARLFAPATPSSSISSGGADRGSTAPVPTMKVKGSTSTWAGARLRSARKTARSAVARASFCPERGE